MTLTINKVDEHGPSNSASCTSDKEDEVDAVLAIEGRHINYQQDEVIQI